MKHFLGLFLRKDIIKRKLLRNTLKRAAKKPLIRTVSRTYRHTIDACTAMEHAPSETTQHRNALKGEITHRNALVLQNWVTVISVFGIENCATLLFLLVLLPLCTDVLALQLNTQSILSYTVQLMPVFFYFHVCICLGGILSGGGIFYPPLLNMRIHNKNCVFRAESLQSVEKEGRDLHSFTPLSVSNGDRNVLM